MLELGLVLAYEQYMSPSWGMRAEYSSTHKNVLLSAWIWLQQKFTKFRQNSCRMDGTLRTQVKLLLRHFTAAVTARLHDGSNLFPCRSLGFGAIPCGI